jgi:hypothetical protein
VWAGIRREVPGSRKLVRDAKRSRKEARGFKGEELDFLGSG